MPKAKLKKCERCRRMEVSYPGDRYCYGCGQTVLSNHTRAGTVDHRGCVTQRGDGSVLYNSRQHR